MDMTMRFPSPRWEFLTLLGGSAAVASAILPLSARAQQRAVPTVGYMGTSTPAVESQRLGVFVQRLRELGWIEGRTVMIEVRWAEARTERFTEIAAGFVASKVDVMVMAGTA